MKKIHFNLYNPASSIFKTSKNDKAETQSIFCSQEDCPLLAKGQCIETNTFANCIYGKYQREDGPTRRAKSFSTWVEQKQEENKGIPYLGHAPKKIEFIGDYVYLPYSHMTMNERVPFLSRSRFLSSGSPFLKKEDWNIKSIVSIVDFHPKALFGDTIMSYQANEIPLFLSHLEEKDNDLFQELIKLRPELYSKKKNSIGRRAILKTVNFPIEFKTNSKYPVSWKWDGKFLTTNSENAFNKTWGDIKKFNIVEIKIEPSNETEIKIQSEDWVNKSTIFID